MDDLVESSNITGKFTSTGRQSGYMIDLYHKGLDEHKHLSAAEQNAIWGKVHNQKLVWQAKWEKLCLKHDQQSKEEQAKERSEDAHNKLQLIETLLEHTIEVNDAINWDDLKLNDTFLVFPEPHAFITYNKSTGYPENFQHIKPEEKPLEVHFIKKVSLFNKILGKEERIKRQQQEEFSSAIEQWEEKKMNIATLNKRREVELSDKQLFWQQEKGKFDHAQLEHNMTIDRLKSLHSEKNSDAIVEYCEMVLNNSQYPDNFPKSFDIQYNEINGILLIDYQLPSLNNIPKVSTVRYVKSRDEIEEKYLSQTDQAKLYDMAIYQIALRTLHELFEADVINAISSISLNGIVTDINPATGHEESTCIISIQARAEEFKKINLAGIAASKSYKECFKSLRGVGSSKLSTMTAIKPLLELDKSDRRFRDHYAVADGLNDAINIASMGWEDFEHLVREIFAKEFTENGGEVKVTQASHDGGVDAIAFDPDPIRGGKIVIQAKRYTNVVGVSAVRDLYGTVMNEGATKGILVTTSDYGADSYAFAKGKPLTLLNGANLLHLLEKHGHKAKIDIREAKKLFKDQVA